MNGKPGTEKRAAEKPFLPQRTPKENKQRSNRSILLHVTRDTRDTLLLAGF